MPIDLPNLDDKTYAELVEEARASITGFHPGWTDHNPSDPGIALIELLAWLSEMVIYRTGQLPERNVHTFLNLLDGGAPPADSHVSLGERTRTTMRTLRERWRAVTPEDYEYLALNQWPGSEEARKLASSEGVAPGLARARCLADRDLSGEGEVARSAYRPGHMSLVVLPAGDLSDTNQKKLSSKLQDFFRERRLLTTHLHVSGPTYVRIGISATLYLRDDAVAGPVPENARAALARYFDPRLGGRGGDGWPFGREVPIAEVYATLDTVPGVEFVEDVEFYVESTLGSRKLKAENSATVVAIRLEAYELPWVKPEPKTEPEPGFIRLTLMERRGGRNEWEVVP